MARKEQPAKVLIQLEGSRAQRGISLFDLEGFIDQFQRALRAFDRSRRLEPGLKSGRPTRRDELVTAFRIVQLKPGSAILTLEQEPTAETISEEEMFPGAPTLAIDNLDALLDAVRAVDDPFDPDVADAVTKARRTLGDNGRIKVKTKRSRRTVVIDAKAEKQVQDRAQYRTARNLRIVGRLHAIDLEPERVGIRATDGVDWVCHYPPEIAAKVKALLDANVWARGVGQPTGAQRGSLEISELQLIGSHEQQELFTFERVPLADLLAEQGITGPTPREALELPDDVTDDQLDAYLADLIGG